MRCPCDEPEDGDDGREFGQPKPDRNASSEMGSVVVTVIGPSHRRGVFGHGKMDYEVSDYFGQQAHLAARLCRACTDKAVAATLGQLAREYAVKAIDFGASPEGFSDILLAPASSMDKLQHRTIH